MQSSRAAFASDVCRLESRRYSRLESLRYLSRNNLGGSSRNQVDGHDFVIQD
jgi:hypothetical protein